MAIDECIDGSMMIDSRHLDVTGKYCGLTQMIGDDRETKIECSYLNREVVGIVGNEAMGAGGGNIRSYQCTYCKS